MAEKNLDTTGQYIWLRYATQYSKDGQTHTIEMSVPVPLGASTGQREELFREAEASMNQLINRFGQHLPQTPPMSVPGRNQKSGVFPMRPNSGTASIPMALGPNLDSSGSLSLPAFIQYINENLNLTPRQAMEMLKVKSLSTGIDLREALERLRSLVAQKNAHSVAQHAEHVQRVIETERLSTPVRFDEEEDPEEGEENYYARGNW